MGERDERGQGLRPVPRAGEARRAYPAYLLETGFLLRRLACEPGAAPAYEWLADDCETAVAIYREEPGTLVAVTRAADAHEALRALPAGGGLSAIAFSIDDATVRLVSDAAQPGSARGLAARLACLASQPDGRDCWTLPGIAQPAAMAAGAEATA